MGRETRNFRQSGKSCRGDMGNKNYARINRQGGWRKYVQNQKRGNLSQKT